MAGIKSHYVTPRAKGNDDLLTANRGIQGFRAQPATGPTERYDSGSSRRAAAVARTPMTEARADRTNWAASEAAGVVDNAVGRMQPTVMSDLELRELVASLSREHQATAREQRETSRVLREMGEVVDKALVELARQSAETKRQLAEGWTEIRSQQAEEWTKTKRQQAEESVETKRQQAEEWAQAKRRREEEWTEIKRQMAEESAKTKRQIAEVTAETKRQMAEGAAETDRHLRRLEGSVGMQFGRFVEAIVEPSCLELFARRGLAVTQSMRRVKTLVAGEELEIDVLLANGRDVVLVEVKSACRVGDVKDVLEDLGRFRGGFPAYAKHQLYGAVAALEYLGGSARYAARHGLFVLESAGGLMAIANRPTFRAKQF